MVLARRSLAARLKSGFLNCISGARSAYFGTRRRRASGRPPSRAPAATAAGCRWVAVSSGVVAALPDVPFLQDFPRAIDTAARGPYPEIAAFLGRHRDRYEPMLKVLNYFDGVNLARTATAPALYSVALMDDVCPPSTVFASFNAYGDSTAHKEIEVYRFNNHEGGQEHHWIKQLQYLRKLLGRTACAV
jgi:cephalosporin-C deacetylase-like acetyl esterase